jgi:hypothetical protein
MEFDKEILARLPKQAQEVLLFFEYINEKNCINEG